MKERMMIFKPVLWVTLFSAASVFAQEGGDPTASICDDEGRLPVLRMKLEQGGRELVVCAPKPDDSRLMVRGVHVTDFVVYSMPGEKVVLRNEKETEHYAILAERGPVRFIRLVWNPATKVYHGVGVAELVCPARGACKLGKAACAVNVPRNPFTAATDAVKAWARDKAKAAYTGSLETDIEKSVLQALSGDRSATALFLDPKSALAGKIEGAAAAAFHEGVEVLRYAKSAGCPL